VGAELFHADTQTDRQTDRHDEANARKKKVAETILIPPTLKMWVK